MRKLTATHPDQGVKLGTKKVRIQSQFLWEKATFLKKPKINVIFLKIKVNFCGKKQLFEKQNIKSFFKKKILVNFFCGEKQSFLKTKK